MKLQTSVRAGGLSLNHNQAQLPVRTGVKAAGPVIQHNQTQRRTA